MTTHLQRLSSKEKMQLVGNMSTMLKAGIPIMEAVGTLLDEAKGTQKVILLQLREDLDAGMSVNESFAKFPNSFDPVTTSLLEAAEEAGTLDVALEDIKENIQREMEFNDKIKSALTYPVFVMVIFVGVLLMMLTFVIPKISQVFSRLRMELPISTKILIYSSNALVNHRVAALITTAVVILLWLLLYKFKRGWLTGIMFSLPVISGLVKQIDLTRFARNMYLLLNAGMPITIALTLAQGVVAKREVRRLIAHALEVVNGGKRFSEGLTTKDKLVPGMVIKLIEVGERSGSLSESMKNISENLDYEVTKNLKNATALLEPIMLVFVGLAVGGIMMSIIGPIYGLISNVRVR